ncbi:hypothetical protein [Sinorhizobium meliloti]|uniref:hypothetical protein n=1 Tax=Rhizobium meliloti TaxID=382 RepID=UPI0010722FF2|nr:hypothetical protein [Sinorhizobium meliloti]MQW30457.1 hypothetical protein [Sinorhizobium meliloti]
MKTSLAPSTRRKHLSALDRLYDSVQRQRGSDSLDRLIAEVDADALEDCLVGFLAQLRNEAAVTNVDTTSTWTCGVSFVSDMLRFFWNLRRSRVQNGSQAAQDRHPVPAART